MPARAHSADHEPGTDTRGSQGANQENAGKAAFGGAQSKKRPRVFTHSTLSDAKTGHAPK
jgi:hypothetical protein